MQGKIECGSEEEKAFLQVSSHFPQGKHGVPNAIRTFTENFSAFHALQILAGYGSALLTEFCEKFLAQSDSAVSIGAKA